MVFRSMRAAFLFLAIAVAIGLAVLYVLLMSRGSGLVASPSLAASALSSAALRPSGSPLPGDRMTAAGIVEPSEENIPVGTPVSGVVSQVFVKVGQQVRAGTPLFYIDDRQYQAILKVRQAALVSAEAELSRLEQMPRLESLPVAEARVREAKAQLTAQQDLFDRSAGLRPLHAIAEEEYVLRKQGYEAACHQVVRMEAEFALLHAGAWEPEKKVARAAVARAKAEVEQARIDLDRLLVRAPTSGQVLQVNVRPGEAVGSPYPKSLIVLGDLATLHVRVDIDGRDISRFRPGGSAKAHSPRPVSAGVCARLRARHALCRSQEFLRPPRSFGMRRPARAPGDLCDQAGWPAPLCRSADGGVARRDARTELGAGPR